MNIARRILGLTFGHRRAVTSGRLKVQGLEGVVTIRRDGWGIPHIDAERAEDAWFGLGFCQGQDRAFQLESLKRAATGTLSALIGKKALPVDRLTRSIGLARTARRQVECQDEVSRACLTAFANGITAGVRQGLVRKPHELSILRSEPTPFLPEHTLAIGGLNALVLSANWDMELSRHVILETDGPEALAALDVPFRGDHPLIDPPGRTADEVAWRLGDDLACIRDLLGSSGGSNNWVLSGSRTKSGKPILANDPHLAPMLPAHWYLAHLRVGDWSVAGASFVGAPCFPTGHNGVAAWGVTAGLVDNTDLFVEEIGPDGRSVREGEAFVPCEVLREVIEVRGGPDEELEVLMTPRGPIMAALEGVDESISVSATWTGDAVGGVRSMLALHDAKTFEEMREALENWPSFSLNFVYADTHGDIGWQLAGTAPQRKAGYGTIPLPGAPSETGWTGERVPYEDMPWCKNPDAGFIATANNKPRQDREDAPFLGNDWLSGYRAARITELLDARSDWTADEVRAMQLDRDCVPWREMRENVLDALRGSAELGEAHAMLERWDGELAPDSVGATYYEELLLALTRRIIKHFAPNSSEFATGRGFNAIMPMAFISLRRPAHVARMVREADDTLLGRPWTAVIVEAASEAWTGLVKRHGAPSDRWSWGRHRPLRMLHALGRVKALAPLFNLGPFPEGGDGNTVAQTAVYPFDSTANPNAIASLRAVFDLADLESSTFALPGGQSGNPCSPHYDDQVALWSEGRGIPIAFSPEAVAAATSSTLVLERK